MKQKFIFILAEVSLLLSICSAVPAEPDYRICTGTSYYDVAYTVRGDKICKGTGYNDIAYTIRK